MCFSASASFAAAGVLSFIGLLSYKKVSHPSQRLFATIPLMFAIQQAAEGVVWLTLDSPLSITHRIAMYTFLTFALLIWPSYIPAALASLEQNEQRKKYINIFCAIGNAASAWLTVSVLTNGVFVQAINCHLVYYFDLLLNHSHLMVGSLYISAILAPFFFSSVRNMWILGIVVAASIITAYHFYYLAFISVWCFFAAIISSIIYLLLQKPSR